VRRLSSRSMLENAIEVKAEDEAARGGTSPFGCDLRIVVICDIGAPAGPGRPPSEDTRASPRARSLLSFAFFQRLRLPIPDPS